VPSPIISKATQKILIPHTAPIKALWGDIPTLDHQGTTFAILPHNPRTQIQLRAAGVEIPAPVLTHFDFPAADGGTPFQVQKETVALATSHQRAYIINDLGTGKTRSSLWAWKYLHDTGVAKKLLVVAPLSTLKFVWLREFGLTMPGVKVAILHGSRGHRLEQLATDADAYVINHDGLRTISDELQQRTDIDTMIIDELAVYRNNSKRSKHMREFAKRFTWVWGMTGKPMPNAPTDVWSQCRILTPHTCPKYFRHAQSALMEQISQFRWVPKDGAKEKALEWMQPSVRFSLDDVVELPDVVYRPLDVLLTEEQLTAYRKLSNEFAMMVENQKITAANAGVALGKLLQIGCGYVYSTNPLYATLDSSTRQEAVLEAIEEAPQKVIVFAPWRHLIDNLSLLFSKNKIDHAVIHGGTKKRDDIFNAFQNTPQYQVLLSDPRCIAHGVTLTAASTIIWYSPIASLDVYEQANARIRRYGQKNKQLILHVQATPVEKKVYGMLRKKQKLQDEFLRMLRDYTP